MRVDALIVGVTTKESTSTGRPYKQVELQLLDGSVTGSTKLYDNCVLDHEFGLFRLREYRELRRGRRIGVEVRPYALVLGTDTTETNIWHVKRVYKPSLRTVVFLQDVAHYLQQTAVKLRKIADVLNERL